MWIPESFEQVGEIASGDVGFIENGEHQSLLSRPNCNQELVFLDGFFRRLFNILRDQHDQPPETVKYSPTKALQEIRNSLEPDGI